MTVVASPNDQSKEFFFAFYETKIRIYEQAIFSDSKTTRKKNLEFVKK